MSPFSVNEKAYVFFRPGPSSQPSRLLSSATLGSISSFRALASEPLSKDSIVILWSRNQLQKYEASFSENSSVLMTMLPRPAHALIHRHSFLGAKSGGILVRQ